jgi:hypothetical protein
MESKVGVCVRTPRAVRSLAPPHRELSWSLVACKKGVIGVGV